MKYSKTTILNTGKQVNYLFFWGHIASRNGDLTKSCLSQCWESSFVIDNIEYKTAEHYMMAEKARLFNNPLIWQKIIDCKSPAEAKKLGRQVEGFSHDIWESKRFEIVKKGNYHKFSQNESLASFLLNTNKRVIVEASPVDAIWGIGIAEDHDNVSNPKKWRGLNLLGFALMEVRDNLKELV